MRHKAKLIEPLHAGSVLRSQKLHVSKKDRTCTRCGKLIQVGEEYLREAYQKLDNGKRWSLTLHTYACTRSGDQE